MVLKGTEGMAARHCKYGPSALPGIKACRLYEPSDKSTAWSDEGTQAHDNLLGVLEGVAVAGSPAVAWAAAYIQGERERACGLMAWYFERRLFTTPRMPEVMQGWFGTADVVAVDAAEKVIYVYDFKTLSRGGDAGWYLPQLMGYAALAFGEFAPADDTPDMWGCVLSVLHGASMEAEEVRCYADECIDVTADLLADKQAICEFGDDMYKPSENRWCKYCARAAGCPVLVRQVDAARLGSEAVPVSWGAMTLPQKIAFIRKAKILFDEAEEEVKEACRRSPDGVIADADGRTVRLVRRRGSVRLPNAACILDSIAKYGVDADAMLGIAKVSKGGVVGLLDAANRDAALSRKDFEDFVDTLGVAGKGKEELVLE